MALAGILCLALCITAAAQTTLPPSVVLVLKILSSTHARPATGIVLTEDGLVVVPAGFVERGDEIVVLEDGTDLTRNARSTRPVARSTELGLAVLATEGLSRPGVMLSLDEPRNGERLWFVAFPPAEELAGGSEPVREQVQVSIQNGMAKIAASTPLPNLNGALLDGCGYLAGLVLAVGEPGLERDTQATVILQPRLGTALAELDANPASRTCRSASTATRAEGDDGTGPGSAENGPQMLDPDSLQPAGPDLSLSEAPARMPDTQMTQQMAATDAENAPEGAGQNVEEEPATVVAESPSLPDSAQPHTGAANSSGDKFSWKWPMAFALAAGLIGWWLGRRGSPSGTTVPSRVHGPDDSSEDALRAPATAPASAGEDIKAGRKPLVLHITYPDGHGESHRVELHSGHSGILLGRGQADVVLPHHSVSRLHGRLRFNDNSLTYSDLGSEGNSWVDETACLEGEIFTLATDSCLQLGHVRLQLAPGGATEENA